MGDARPTPAVGLPDMYADLATSIIRDIIAPDYAGEVRDLAVWRRRWRKISNWVEGLAHVMLGAATILAFSAGFFDSQFLTYASACSSTACLAMLRFSAYASNESVERNTALIRMLSAMGISPEAFPEAQALPEAQAPPEALPEAQAPAGASPAPSGRAHSPRPRTRKRAPPAAREGPGPDARASPEPIAYPEASPGPDAE